MKLLVFTNYGGAELLSGTGKVAKILWSTDDDTEFMETFANDVIDPDSEDDLEEVQEYLIDSGFLEEGEPYESQIQMLEGGPGDDEDDEDDEDYARDHFDPNGRIEYVP